MIPLKCAACGANLDIGPDIDIFACGYCGTNQKVERKGGTVSLRRIEDAIGHVQRGVDRTAAELAIPRLKQDLIDIEIERQRLLGTLDRDDGSIVAGLAVAFAVAVYVIGWWSLLALAVVSAAFLKPFRTREAKTQAINDAVDGKIKRLRQQLDAHRTVID